MNTQASVNPRAGDAQKHTKINGGPSRPNLTTICTSSISRLWFFLLKKMRSAAQSINEGEGGGMYYLLCQCHEYRGSSNSFFVLDNTYRGPFGRASILLCARNQILFGTYYPLHRRFILRPKLLIARNIAGPQGIGRC